MMEYPKEIVHWIGGADVAEPKNRFVHKIDPANGAVLSRVLRGEESVVGRAVTQAQMAYDNWSSLSVIARAKILRDIVLFLSEKKEEIARMLSRECGKPLRSARVEVDAALECGFFFAGEGQRYGEKILQSAVSDRSIQLVRQSIGVGALITPFNNPFAGIVWKTFPALLCGNTVVVKAHEWTPYIPVLFGKLMHTAGLPAGVYNVVQGFGSDVGQALVKDFRISFVSFTGSAKTAKSILQTTAERGVKVCVETGGKNPLVVCDDADMERAVASAVSGAFVDAGQRCAATSRIIVFDSVYDTFMEMFLKKVQALKVGVSENDDYGAIISEKRLNEILSDIAGAVERGARICAGGIRPSDGKYGDGYFITPTVLENVTPYDELSYKEIFGPVVAVYRVKDLEEAITLANDSEYRLSGAVHTKNIERAWEFVRAYRAGVVRVNGPTHGSEPHVPFGGIGISGNGWREPGSLALDFYSEWKQVSWE